MSINIRVALLLGLLLAGFVAAPVLVRYFERTERAELLRSERETRVQLLNHLIESKTRALPQFASESAQTEELTKLLLQSDCEVARNLTVKSSAAAGTRVRLVISLPPHD